MKKLSVLLILVMSVLLLKAAEESVSYVTFDGKTYFGEKVKSGLFNMNLTMSDGTIVKVPLKKVESYSTNGRIFERLPVICEDGSANCTALMELVTTRNGYRLYKHCECRESGDLLDNTYKKAHLQVEYYVFKDGKFFIPVNKENAESVLGFFGIKALWS